MKFLVFHGNQLEYNGRQGTNGAGQAEKNSTSRLVHNLCTDTIIHKAAYSSCKTMFLSRL